MKLNFETIVKSGNDKAVNEVLSYFTSFRDLSSQPSVENDGTPYIIHHILIYIRV